MQQRKKEIIQMITFTVISVACLWWVATNNVKAKNMAVMPKTISFEQNQESISKVDIIDDFNEVIEKRTQMFTAEYDNDKIEDFKLIKKDEVLSGMEETEEVNLTPSEKSEIDESETKRILEEDSLAISNNEGLLQDESVTIPVNEETSTTQRPLEEILADPNAKIVELIPYLKGSFEDNVYLLSHLAMSEARGGTDESQQANFRVAVVRAFDPQVSNGDGDLKSALFFKYKGKYQFGCVAPGGSFWREPDEQCIRNAREFLSGNVLEPDKGITAFYIGTVTRKKEIESTYAVDNWKTKNPNDTLTVYVYNKW